MTCFHEAAFDASSNCCVCVFSQSLHLLTDSESNKKGGEAHAKALSTPSNCRERQAPSNV